MHAATRASRSISSGTITPPPPPKTLTCPAPRSASDCDEVLEVLDVPALVRRDRDALDVLLDRRVDDLLDRAVVPEVDHLGALRLQDPPHDVDRRVVAVEQARGGDQPDRVLRAVEGGRVRHRDLFVVGGP